ncbi:hypothetical protein ONZ45_g18399 [Pleurotus djamor]|nr:hypothetical protein ONZ45_g18399 [Pleurotus djamor]
MSTSSILSQRRRSSAAHNRPAAPPPNHPIPSIPSQPSSPPRTGAASPEASDLAYHSLNQANGSSAGYPYTRPSPSTNLAAVAAYASSQATAPYSSSQSPQLSSASSSVENLSDPPPRSSLPSSRRSPEQVPRVPNDNYLLTPPEPRSHREGKPSSRRALMRALELAREAVNLDSSNDDPLAAVQAYGKSVALLSEVMERVRRGEDSTDPNRRKGSRRRSMSAQEDEVKRLKSISDLRYSPDATFSSICLLTCIE